MSHVGPEPAEEPGESGDGPEIDARPLGDAVNRHPGGQAITERATRGHGHDAVAEPVAGGIDDVDDAVLRPLYRSDGHLPCRTQL